MTLSPVERAVVADLSCHGDNVPGNISDNTGYHEKSVSRSLSNLEDRDIVRNKGRGVWSLTEHGETIAKDVLEWQKKTGSYESA